MLETFAFNYANYHSENMQLVTHPIDIVKQCVAVKREFNQRVQPTATKTAGKNCTSTSATCKVTGQAFAARNVVGNNWDYSSSGHAVPQRELVLPAPFCKHANYPTIGTVTTRSYARTLPGQHRQVLTQLQPQNRNGNPGTLTCLGNRSSLFFT